MDSSDMNWPSTHMSFSETFSVILFMVLRTKRSCHNGVWILQIKKNSEIQGFISTSWWEFKTNKLINSLGGAVKTLSLSNPARWNSSTRLAWLPRFHSSTNSFGTLKVPSALGVIKRSTRFLIVWDDRALTISPGAMTPPAPKTPPGDDESAPLKERHRLVGGGFVMAGTVPAAGSSQGSVKVTRPYPNQPQHRNWADWTYSTCLKSRLAWEFTSFWTNTTVTTTILGGNPDDNIII